MSKSAKKILKTAETLFNQHSFVAVGVDLIRDQSGCSKTTLYTYFKNKQQLVYAVLQQRDQRFRDSLLDAVQNENGIAALEHIYAWHIAWFQADHFKGCLFVRAVSESSSADSEIAQIAQNHKHWLYQLIAAKISHLNHSTEITAFFYTQLEGLISRFMVDGFDQGIAEQHKNLIFKMIAMLQAKIE